MFSKIRHLPGLGAASAGLLLLALTAPGVGAVTLTGAGSTAAAPVYRALAEEYGRTSGTVLDYQAVGSSAGLKKIRAGEVMFGASDVAPPEADLNKEGLVLVPMFVTGAVPVVNLPGTAKEKLKLNGETLARLFLGEIVRWNDPALQQLNPQLRLPDLPVKPVVRGDSSGTTYYFSDYLTHASDTWHKRYPAAATSLTAPSNAIAANGSDGVATTVLATSGAIGYIDFSYISARGLTPVQMQNESGEFVEAHYESFASALRNSDWFLKGDIHASLANLPGKQSWPLMMGTFVVLPHVAKSADQSEPALRFFLWSLLHGDALINSLGFVHLPENVQALAFRNMSSIVTRNNQSIGIIVMSSMLGGAGAPAGAK